MKEAKQVIIMRKDLNMRKGKMVAQGSHASCGVILKMMRGNIEHNEYQPPEDDYSLTLNVPKNTALYNWISFQFKKVTVSVDSEEELLSIYEKAKEANIPVALIQDAGHTEFHGVPTYTCLAIGPAFSEEIDPISGHLKLL